MRVTSRWMISATRFTRTNGFPKACLEYLRQARLKPLPLVRQAFGSDVQREQLKLLALTIGLFAVVGTTSDALLVIEFRPNFNLLSGTISIAIPALYINLVAEALRWKRSDDNRLFLRNSVISFAFLGVAWAMLVNLLSIGAGPSQKGLIDGMLIALVSTPMVAAPLSAAAAFWIPNAIAGVIILTTPGETSDLGLLACFLGYATFTLAAIVIVNRCLLERSIGRIMLEQQNQTIGVFLRDYEENAADWLWETDPELNLQNVSQRLAEVARQPRALLEGSSLLDLLKVDTDCQESLAIRDLFRERSPFRNLSLTVKVEDETRWWAITGRPVVDDGARFRGYRGIGSDVTEVRRSEERVRYLAMHDSLTGLVNRQSFMDSLHAIHAQVVAAEQGITSAGIPDEDRFAIHLLDLDRFKNVNDTFGHAVGDALLRAVADRLRGCVRSGSIIARLGGDEFGIVSCVADAVEASMLAQRIIETLNRDYALAGGRQTIGVSVGVAFVTSGEATPFDQVRQADLALYAAKAAGRGVFRFFHAEMDADHRDRLTLQADLEAAIHEGALSLVYQPILDVRRTRVASLEALCRWVHPSLGPISPSRFIPLAEEAGLIVRLGEWTLAQACHEASGWPADIRVAVNVSPLQITGSQFQTVVARVLSDSGLPPGRLELELTEHAYLDATERTLQVLQALRGSGSRLVLDDFGTGYSSISYLAKFKFDGIKMDTSFIRNLEVDPTKAAVVRAVAQLAADMDIPITAEGVENVRQEQLLLHYGVTHLQGYLIGHPMEARHVADFLLKESASDAMAERAR